MKISKPEYRTRMTNLQERLKINEVDTLIVSEEEDIYYLTGLTYKSLERLFLLVVKPNKVEFILPKMELAHLREVDNVDQIICYWEYPAKGNRNFLEKVGHCQFWLRSFAIEIEGHNIS